MLTFQAEGKRWRSQYGWQDPDKGELYNDLLTMLAKKLMEQDMLTFKEVTDKDGNLTITLTYQPKETTRKGKR